MTDDRVEELLFDINGKLAAISTKLDAVSDLAMNHETRIRGLEENMKEIQSSGKEPKDNTKEESFKAEILKLLAKALLIAIVAIGSLTGATSMMKEVLAPASAIHIQQ